ncbi:reverse transcriptase domain-containing protein [Tanacetum coccineum]
MTLELEDRSITRPKGIAEDIFVKVGKFHFPTDFVVVDFDVNPRVPLILRRSFLRTGRALIDGYGEEITLRVNDKVVTFTLNQTTRYSFTYDDILLTELRHHCGGVIDEIDAFLDMDISTDIENGDHDSEGDIIYLESLLIDDTIPNLPSEVFLDHDPRSLKDEPDNDDLMSKDKVFNLRI